MYHQWFQLSVVSSTEKKRYSILTETPGDVTVKWGNVLDWCESDASVEQGGFLDWWYWGKVLCEKRKRFWGFYIDLTFDELQRFYGFIYKIFLWGLWGVAKISGKQ